MSDTKTLIGLLFDLSDTIEGADGDNGFLISKAADTLEQLERENAALRARLKESEGWRSVGDQLNDRLKAEIVALVAVARKEEQP